MFFDRHGHFFRTRTRHNVAVARRYLRGLAQAEDCTFESMAAVVEGGCAQQFQHFISCSLWDHEPVVAQIGQDADRLLGGKPTSALIIDESSFPKQGVRSVGVARQWTGRLGKIDNCQVAVFGVLTDGERHTPIDARLYLPERWIEDPARCERAGIPEAAREKMSKSELALDIVRRARAVQSSGGMPSANFSTVMDAVAGFCFFDGRPRPGLEAGTWSPGSFVQMCWLRCTSATKVSFSSSNRLRKSGSLP